MKSKKQETPVKNRRLDGYGVKQDGGVTWLEPIQRRHQGGGCQGAIGEASFMI